MAGKKGEADVGSDSNRKNLMMLNHFLRPKVLGAPLIGSDAVEEMDVYMRHPAELFGSSLSLSLSLVLFFRNSLLYIF